MKRYTIKHQVIAKTENRRIKVSLLLDEENTPLIAISTKRLEDFKKRKISYSSNLYSIETIIPLIDLLKSFMINHEVKREINRELGKLSQWECFTDLEL